MYFPIFRGRQYEMLALRELLLADRLSEKIIPIIEPVKVTPSFFKSLEAFIQKKHKVAVINNPQVGEWLRELNDVSNKKNRAKFDEIMESEFIVPSYYVSDDIDPLSISDNCILICNNPDSISFYDCLPADSNIAFNLIPDKSDFRRKIRANRVMMEDHFCKRQRNSDYASEEDEFFSSDHLYFADENYKGFSDYSVIGEEFNDTGFAPYAVAIHIIYMSGEKSLRVRHFVSDSNADIKNVAGKFYEAVLKLHNWNKQQGLTTMGMNEFEKCFANESYSGLGVIKKYSVMHHLELIGLYLDGNHDLL